MDLKAVGLRITVLIKAMCPKRYVDRVPARFITSYRGDGTEWVENAQVHRNKDRAIEVLKSALINRLVAGQVGLMKGEWCQGHVGNRSAIADVYALRTDIRLHCMM